MIEKKLCVELIKKQLSENGVVSITVFGNSMLPTINNGQKIMVYKCADYKVGDIICYCLCDEKNVSFVVHRIIFLRKSFVLAKGDNNSFIDKFRIPYSDIIGAVKTCTQKENANGHNKL